MDPCCYAICSFRYAGKTLVIFSGALSGYWVSKIRSLLLLFWEKCIEQKKPENVLSFSFYSCKSHSSMRTHAIYDCVCVCVVFGFIIFILDQLMKRIEQSINFHLNILLILVVCLLNSCMCLMLNGFGCARCKCASHRNSSFDTKIQFLNRIKCNRSLRKWRAHIFTIKIKALVWTENYKHTNTICNNDRSTCTTIAMKFPWNRETTK